MSTLEKLKSAKDRSDVAKFLGFTPKALTYVLFKIHESKKYSTFEIPKKSGGTRTINAPVDRLSLLQSRLSEALYECARELHKKNPRFWMPSHAFRPDRTIVSNASAHRRRRYVFNVDIEDFFGTINFGRVRGFFIKDRAFELEPSVATVIAQIACYQNALPQGSPCSPVISNFVGRILDSRLVALAQDNRCTYTRYADDLTFSTSDDPFPSEIAVNVRGETWIAGKRLDSEIDRAGFKLNQAKTRMSLRQSRQTVTGLVVNDKANINQDYYRAVRAMCAHVFKTGSYFKAANNGEDRELIENLRPLEGMLSHIHFVKARRDRSEKERRRLKKTGEFSAPKAPEELYRKFLFFKNFVALDAPLIVPEGKTDVTYLRCAIKALAASFPSLIKPGVDEIEFLISFFKPSEAKRDILNLGQGAAGQTSLIAQYSRHLKDYAHKPLLHPVIILCDNDDGPKQAGVFAQAKTKSGSEVSLTTTAPFYYLRDNLYLVKVPEGGAPSRDVEDLFPNQWLEMKLDGRQFNRGKGKGFDKVDFADKIVRPNADKIDFTEFSELLARLDGCIQHYQSVLAAAQSKIPAVGAGAP